MEPCNFPLPQAQKIKEFYPRKVSYISGNENPETFLIFSKKKAVLMFRETKNLKKRFIFQEKELSSYFRKGILSFLALYTIHRIKEVLYKGIVTKSILLITDVNKSRFY